MKTKLLMRKDKSMRLKAQRGTWVQFQERSVLEEEASQVLKAGLEMPLRLQTEAIALGEEAGGLTIDY